MKTKFTGGEWIPQELSEISNGFANINYPNGFISIYGEKFPEDNELYKQKIIEELLATQKLISAAPDMFNALEDLLSELEDCSLPSSLNFYIHNAKIALNKVIAE